MTLINKNSLLSQLRLKELLNYDEHTGEFTWKVYRGSRAQLGDVAGSPMKSGYLEIGIDQRNYYAHRLAVLYMTGEFPSDLVDHDDGNKQNNRWINLNSVDKSGNAKNAARSPRNKSGITGVCWVAAKRRWKAEIRNKPKNINLGYFVNLYDAAAARKSAELRYGYNSNHGRVV